MRVLSSVVTLSILLLPSLASAQALDFGEVANDPFSVSVSPQYVAPLSNAVLSFVSGDVDLTTSTLVVLVDGKEVYRGVPHAISVPMKKAGVLTTITLKVLVGKKTYTKTVSLRPQDVLLISEPLSTVPPLYPGKGLTPQEGSVRLVAVANLLDANGKPVKPSEIAYRWTVDGTEIASASGLQKSSIVVDSPDQYRSRDVHLDVSAMNGTIVGGADTTINPVDPIIRLYESSPLLGIRFEKTLYGSYTLSAPEISLYAAPFGFSRSDARESNWFLNGSSVQKGPVVTLRPTGSGKGTASLTNTTTAGAFSTATANLTVQFGSDTSNSLFSL